MKQPFLVTLTFFHDDRNQLPSPLRSSSRPVSATETRFGDPVDDATVGAGDVAVEDAVVVNQERVLRNIVH